VTVTRLLGGLSLVLLGFLLGMSTRTAIWRLAHQLEDLVFSLVVLAVVACLLGWAILTNSERTHPHG
jgi:hypothetical protein